MSNPPSQPIIAIDIPIMLFDGDSPDNPGQGAAAAILLMPNGRRYTVSQLLSSITIPEAEYTGLIIGLQKAKKLRIKELEVKGDSEVVFNQVNGLSPVTTDKLRTLHQQVRKLMREFDKVSLEWIPREQNRSARAAVKRCIGDALGRESSTPSAATTPQPHLYPAIAEMIQLGEQATVEDYRNLQIELDEFSLKSLSELRTFVPTDIQDTIALQWNGKEEELAEMYRWYLRGLPPKMAINKVKIDENSQIEPPPEKLPWEEALSLSTEAELSDSGFLLPDPFSSPSQPSEPTAAPTSQSSAEWVQTDSQSQETWISEAYIETSEEQSTPLKDDSDQDEPELLDKAKDTLPSRERVQNILEIIEQLSAPEKVALAKELVKLPSMVSPILKAMADNMAGDA